MHRPNLRRLVATFATLLSSGTQTADAQVLEGFSLFTHAGVGYVVDAPSQLNGIGGFVFGPRLGGWGVYLDAKRTHESRRNESGFVDDITVAEAETEFRDRGMGADDHWTGVNAAVVRVVSGGLAVYGGAGYAKKTAFRRYYDETQTRGVFGTYWLEDPADSGARLNVLGGGLFRATRRLVFQFGFETAPVGASVGVYLAQPFAW